jgi:signal transduction histidine kinase
MKIKTWLMISYLVIMLLPFLFAYLFYQWLDHFYEKQAFHDFLEAELLIAKLDSHLQHPEIFLQPEVHEKELKALSVANVGIRLFSASGDVLYAHPTEKWKTGKISQMELYQDLNHLKTGIRAHTIKKPVFLNHQIAGIYELTIMRIENVQKLSEKRNWLIVFFLLTFALIYGVMILLVSQKLIKPIKNLMTQMDLLGSGESFEKLPARRDEIGDLIKHFERMKNLLSESQIKIKETQKEKEHMIASITHDLKTPLTSIRAYSESVLQNNLSNQVKQEYLETIVKKVDFMKQMFDDLTTYTLLQDQERSVEKVAVESEELFDMLFSGYEELCSQKNISLSTEINITGMLEVNIQQMTRVIDNLFSNALKFTNRGGHIWLGAFSAKNKVPHWLFPPFLTSIEANWKGHIILVQNQGKAIPLDEQDKILRPLYQVETSRNKKDNGTGLGLSIVNKILEKHQGSIRVFSKEGYGTLVVCYLPDYT